MQGRRHDKVKVTREMHDALEVLREYARIGPPTSSVLKAINVLDNADVFAEIDDTRPIRFNVELLYQITDRSTGGTRIRSYCGLTGYDDDDVVSKAEELFVNEMIRAELIRSADDVVFVKANTEPCV